MSTIAAPQHLRQPNLNINLLHPLKVCLSSSLRPKNHVHLFQRQALRLWYEKPDERRTEIGEQAEQDICSIRDPLEHVGSDLADDEVVHPV